jgi:AcrR family transcriptional regulator
MTLTTRPRDRILDAATRLFSREGIQAVGVDRVIAEADVAPMTLYRQFGGKDAVVATALEQWSEGWLRWLGEQLEPHADDPEARLEALWGALEDWMGAPDFRGSFVANAAAELRSQPDHPAQPVIAAHRAALRRLLEDLARAAGVDDPARVARQLQVLIDGAAALAVADGRSAATSVRPLAHAVLASGRQPARTPAAATSR